MSMRSPAVLAAALAAFPAAPARAQDLPLAPSRGSDQAVSPAFEGWYDNGDGTYVVYFGYFNRNEEQEVDIPLGEANFIEPRELDGRQPTHFAPGRDWGVFGVVVPSDYPRDARIYWNLVQDGHAYRVPGHLHADWQTDALGGGAAGNRPPAVRFGTAEGRGPAGVTSPTALRAGVGQPLELRVAATDPPNAGPDPMAALAGAAGGGRGGRGGRGGASQVTLAWFKHRGPGGVSFSPASSRVPAAGGEATTMATFEAPGDYVIRVRATDAGIAQAGHAQCCWTNGFVNVTVTR